MAEQTLENGPAYGTDSVPNISHHPLSHFLLFNFSLHIQPHSTADAAVCSLQILPASRVPLQKLYPTAMHFLFAGSRDCNWMVGIKGQNRN